MVIVQQAVFTSAETDRSAGYQLLAQSPGVCEADARELAVWGPSHDSLVESGPEASSLNFHPLPSGAFCISRTTLAGWEYSSRGGHRVYTHCLIVSPEVLARFANNPFALLRAVTANGSIEVYAEVPPRLEPLQLAGRAAAVDQMLLSRLAANPGPEWMGALVQAALDSVCLAVAGGPPAEYLVAGLVSCLPPECRTEFSFTTGLKFSTRRPFRIVGYSGPLGELRQFQHRYNLTVLDLSGRPPAEFAPIDGWSRLIQRALASGRTSFLATQLSKRRFELAVEDLPALGLQLLEDLDASALRGDPVEKQPRSCGAAEGVPSLQHAHAAHRQRQESSASVAAADFKAGAPSKKLDPDSPEVLEKLELLDDAVFEAIGGKTAALETLKSLWPQVRNELGEEMVAESQEQYLRYALSIWEEYIGSCGVRNPARAIQAMDVLCVLFDNV